MASPYDKFYAQNLEQATAQKPFIQQDVDVAQEHTRNIQNVAMQYAQQNEIPYEQSLNLMNARWDNQQKQKAFAIEDETRGLNAHNAALDAGIALRKVDLTAPDAVQKISSIKSSLAPHAGTKEADPVFQEADTMLNTTKGFEKERMLREAQERATKVEERKAETEARKAQQESPEGVAARAKALQPITIETAKQEIIAREDAAEKLAEARAALHPEDKLKKAGEGMRLLRVDEQNIQGKSPVSLGKLGSPSYFLDEKGGRTTQDKAKQAVWMDKKQGKIILDESNRQELLQDVQLNQAQQRILREEASKAMVGGKAEAVPSTATAPVSAVPMTPVRSQPATTPMVEPPTEEPVAEAPVAKVTAKQAKGFSDENPFTSFIATTKPKAETFEEQTRRLNPEKVQQESDANVVNAATELSKIEDEAKKAQEMGADKYKELYGIDPSSYAVKWERANNKMKDALARSIFEDALKTSSSRKEAAEKAKKIAEERGYKF